MESNTDFIPAIILTAFAVAVVFLFGYVAHPACVTGHDIDGMIQQKLQTEALNPQPTEGN